MQISKNGFNPITTQMQMQIAGVGKVKSPIVKKEDETTGVSTETAETFQQQESPALGLIGEKPVKTGVETPSLPAPETEAKDASGIISNSSNGTLAVIEDPVSRKSAQSEGINFAKLYGIDTGAKAGVPQNFTDKEVEGFYFKNGVENANGRDGLSEDGLKLYEAIKARYLDSVPKTPYGSPTLYLTGGLPGSGKGYILSEMMGDSPQIVRVDPDELKKDIIKDLAEKNPRLKEQMAEDKGWGTTLHETSSFLAKELMKDALGSGKDIVFDSSMASKNVSKYRDYARTARQNSYKVVGIISDVSEATANRRAIKRANKPTKVALETGETISLPGRLTESSYIADCAKNLDSNLNTYIGEALYDHLMIYDNNSEDSAARMKAIYNRESDSSGKPVLQKRDDLLS